jgi:molecular chaperone DnaK (HSP70)
MDDKIVQMITMGMEAFASVVMTYFIIKRYIGRVDKKLEEIEQRLDMQYRYIKDATITAGVSVAWGEKAPFVEVVKAILLNLKLGANGNTEERLKEVIMGMPNGLQLFRSIFNDFIKNNKVSAEFHQVIERATRGMR